MHDCDISRLTVKNDVVKSGGVKGQGSKRIRGLDYILDYVEVVKVLYKQLIGYFIYK